MLYVVLSGTMLTITFGYHANSSLTKIDPDNNSSIDSVATDNGTNYIAENILQSSTINSESRNNSSVNSVEVAGRNNKSDKMAEVTDNATVNIDSSFPQKDTNKSQRDPTVILFVIIFKRYLD